MKLQQTTVLSLALGAVYLVAGGNGGCFEDPCPDLYISCPDLECAQGFKVDKSGCAICECVGDVDPEPTDCRSDRDCPQGMYCALECPSNADCAETFGQCRPDDNFVPCERLDEQSCFERSDCEAQYDQTWCDCEEGNWDCWCGETIFIGCVERQVQECWGAWLDERGTCRSPNDGIYPDYCCAQQYCSSDRECAAGESCVNGVCQNWQQYECYWDGDCPSGQRCEFVNYTTSDSSEQLDIAMGGYCVPFECMDNSDCPSNMFCAFGYYDDAYDAGPAEGSVDGGTSTRPAMMYGVCIESHGEGCIMFEEEACLNAQGCMPVYEPCMPCDCAPGDMCWCDDTRECNVFAYCTEVGPQDPCQGLDERSCIEARSCEPLYYAESCLCDVDAGCDCAPSFWYQGCQSIYVNQECYTDAECGEGYFCDMYNDGGDVDAGSYDPSVDGGVAPAPERPWGVCVPIQPVECYSDADCGAGYVCDMGYYAEDYYDAGVNDPAVDGGVAPAPVRPWGVCVPMQEPTCEGAWRDASGTCRAPNDGIYPDYCCDMYACSSDADCPNGYCDNNTCIYPYCDDGGEVYCDMVPMECAPGMTLAARDGCFTCVDARTCGYQSMCWSDSDCAEGEFCLFSDAAEQDPMPSVDGGAGLVAVTGVCAPYEVVRPECEVDIDCMNGVCVEGRCEYPSCGDGSEPWCNCMPPVCENGAILVTLDNCWACVDPVTCERASVYNCQ